MQLFEAHPSVVDQCSEYGTSELGTPVSTTSDTVCVGGPVVDVRIPLGAECASERVGESVAGYEERLVVGLDRSVSGQEVVDENVPPVLSGGSRKELVSQTATEKSLVAWPRLVRRVSCGRRACCFSPLQTTFFRS